MSIKEIRPSSLLCNVEINQLFEHENGHKYILLYRDAVKGIVKRWFWWNDVGYQIARRFKRYAQD